MNNVINSVFLRIICFIVFFSFGTSLMGQEAKIIDAGKLYSTFVWTEENLQLLENAIGKEMARQISIFSQEYSWPYGIARLSDRSTKRQKFSEYKAVKVIDLPKGYTVIKIPALENKHMPEEMRPHRDIFFVIGSDGVQLTNTLNNNSLQGTNNQREFRVVEPGKLYATYNMNPNQLSQLGSTVPASKIEEVKTYAHERTWPSGISTLSAWSKNKNNFYNYVLYYVGEFDDKYVLLATPQANAHMPEDMRPVRDIYFIFDKIAVKEVSAQPANQITSGMDTELESSRVRVFNYGSLMPFFMYNEEHYKEELGIDAEQLDILKTFGNQGGWPGGIATFQDRNKNSIEMVNYAVYLVGKIDGGRRVVLLCPAAQNQHMPTNMRPSNDIYFALESNGVAFGNAVPLKAKAFRTANKKIDEK